MDKHKNYFELFSLPVDFDVDLSDLNTRFRNLQKVAHPDKYSSAIEQERLQSIQQASRINDGYTTIKNPINRAKYILQIAGFDDEAENNVLESAFLMAQIRLREQIEEAQARSDIDLLDEISDQITTLLKNTTSTLSELFAAQTSRYKEVAIKVQEGQFFARLLENIDSIILDIESNE